MDSEKELNNKINNINKKENQGHLSSQQALQESFDFYQQNEKDNQKNNTSVEELVNDKKKLNDLLTTELMNKMKLISPIPQSNAPKRKMSGVLMTEKEDGNEYDEYLDEKEEDNFSSSDNDNVNENEEDKEDDNLKIFHNLNNINTDNNKNKSYIKNDNKKEEFEEKKNSSCFISPFHNSLEISRNLWFNCWYLTFINFTSISTH